METAFHGLTLQHDIGNVDRKFWLRDRDGKFLNISLDQAIAFETLQVQHEILKKLDRS